MFFVDTSPFSLNRRKLLHVFQEPFHAFKLSLIEGLSFTSLFQRFLCFAPLRPGGTNRINLRTQTGVSIQHFKLRAFAKQRLVGMLTMNHNQHMAEFF